MLEEIMNAVNMLSAGEATTGALMALGGCAGLIIAAVALLVCLAAFPGQRRRLFERLKS